MNELSLVSVGGFKSKNDDFIDTVSMLPMMKAWRPSEEAPLVTTGKDDGMWELELDDEPANRMASYIV